MKKIIIFLVTSFFWGNYVYGFCYAPTAPSNWDRPTKPTKPMVPFCVNEWNNTHTCDDWTINSYNNDVEYYNSQLQSYSYDVDDYIRKLQYYVDEARDYANCEIRNLN